MSRTPTRTPSRRALVATGAVLAGLLPLAAPPASTASTGTAECLSEQAELLAQRCDDITPPETAVVSSTPAVNRNVYLSQDDVTIRFTGTHPDADTDPVALQCQLYDTAAAPTTWTTCTSPVTYTDLDDTGATPYTFRARSVDTADDAITATAGLLPRPAATDAADVDQSPAATTFFVDTAAPNTFVFDEPFDEVSPDFPMLTRRDLSVELSSTEPDATFSCTLTGRAVPCSAGRTRVARPAPGDQVLRVAATDPAGNTDPTVTVTPFSVPTNLGSRMAKGWSRVTAPGSYAGDVLRSTRRGSTVRFTASQDRELRIIAPRGPRLGKVEIQVGSRAAWQRLPQTSGRSAPFAVVYQRFFDRRFSGTITLRVVSASDSRPARVDAALLH